MHNEGRAVVKASKKVDGQMAFNQQQASNANCLNQAKVAV
jgi:hypothetical protein